MTDLWFFEASFNDGFFVSSILRKEIKMGSDKAAAFAGEKICLGILYVWLQ